MLNVVQRFNSLKEAHQGVVALVLLAWVFATMGLFARVLDTNFDLFEQTYLRIAFAFIIGAMLFYPKLRYASLTTLSSKDATILFFRAVLMYLGVVMFTEAILHTKFSNASIIAVLPLMPVLGYVFLRETVKVRTLIWIGIGFIGSVLVALQSLQVFSFGYGELMALLSLLFFDLSYVTRKWQSETLNNYESTVIMFAFAVPFLFVTSIMAGESLPRGSDFSFFMITILFLAGFFNVINLFLTNFGFQHVKAAVAGNIITLEVFFALLYGVFLYGEIPVVRELIGGTLILLSVFFVNKLENQ